MDELFEKIYKEIICNEKDMAELGMHLEGEINGVMENYRDSLEEVEREKLLLFMDDLAASAQKGGFCLGVRYAVKGIFALLADNGKQHHR